MAVKRLDFKTFLCFKFYLTLKKTIQDTIDRAAILRKKMRYEFEFCDDIHS